MATAKEAPNKEAKSAKEKWQTSAKALTDAVRDDKAEEANCNIEKLYETALDDMKHWQPKQKEELSKFYVFVVAAFGLKNPADACQNSTLKTVLEKAGGCDLFVADVTGTGSYRTPVLMFAFAWSWLLPKTSVVMRDTALLAVLHLAREVDAEFMSKVIAPKGRERHQTLLFIAAYYASATLMKGMIDLFGEESLDERKKLFMTKDVHGDNPLHRAIKTDKPKVVAVILDALLDEDLLADCNDEDHTALHMAVQVGSMEVAKVLLTGVQKFLEGKDSDTPIWEQLGEALAYAKRLERMDILLAAVPAVPKAFRENAVAGIFGLADAAGKPLVEALAPQLMVSTQSNFLWEPEICLGSDPWVKHVKCNKPEEVMDETGYTDRKGARLVIANDEKKQAEEGPQGLLHMWRSSKVDCKAYMLPAHLLMSTTVLRALTKASGMLRTPLAGGLLANWWANFEIYYYIDVLLNLLHLCLVLLLTYLSRNGRTGEAGPYIIAAAVLVFKDVFDELFALVDVISDLRRRKASLTIQQSFEYCFEQSMDYSRLAIEVLALLAFLSQGDGQAADIFTKLVTAAWVFFWWCHFLFDLRGLRSFGPFLMPIFRAINTWSVINMAVVVFCVLAASTHAYYALGVRGEPSQLYAAILQMYRLGVLGDFDIFELEGTDPTLVAAGADIWEPEDPKQSAEYELVHCVFYVTTLSITVVLMNLFIGVLGSSYDKAKDMSEELFLSTRARLVLEYRVALLPRIVNALKGKFGHDNTGSADGAADQGSGTEFAVVFLRREDEGLGESMRSFVKGEMEAVRRDQQQVSKVLEEMKKELTALRAASEKEGKGGPGKSSTELSQGEKDTP